LMMGRMENISFVRSMPSFASITESSKVITS